MWLYGFIGRPVTLSRRRVAHWTHALARGADCRRTWHLERPRLGSLAASTQVRWHPLRGADLPAPDDSRRATADGRAVGAAAATPPVGGALVVAWAALRRRSGRPGSGGSLPPHHFEMPADHFEMPAPAARGRSYSFFY